VWFRYPKLVDCTIGTNAPLPDSQPVDLMVQQVLDVLPAHALSCVTDTILTSVIFPRARQPRSDVYPRSARRQLGTAEHPCRLPQDPPIRFTGWTVRCQEGRDIKSTKFSRAQGQGARILDSSCEEHL
jgi:hypothetical protein